VAARSRLPGQQAVQDQAGGEHVAFGGQAVPAQRARVERGGGVPGHRRRRFGRARADGERHHAGLAALVEKDLMRLHVAMRDTGVVREGQPAQHAAEPLRHLVVLRPRVLGKPLVERRADTAIDGDIGPLLERIAGDHRGDRRMVETRGAACLHQPLRERLRLGGRHARHRQHQFLRGVRIERQPRHRRFALADERAQGVAPERARGRRRREDVGGGRRHSRTKDEVARLDARHSASSL